MNEKQAIKHLKNMKMWENDAGNVKAYDVAINALREVKRYREFEEIMKKCLSHDAIEFLKDEEEFAKWLERGKWIAKRCDEINRELEQYRALGTVEELTKMKKDYAEAWSQNRLE